MSFTQHVLNKLIAYDANKLKQTSHIRNCFSFIRVMTAAFTLQRSDVKLFEIMH